MCFKITFAQREYYHYRGISAELEQRGCGSSRPELARAIRQKQQVPGKPEGDQNDRGNVSSPSIPDPE
jgi:hypothetical protein